MWGPDRLGVGYFDVSKDGQVLDKSVIEIKNQEDKPHLTAYTSADGVKVFGFNDGSVYIAQLDDLRVNPLNTKSKEVVFGEDNNNLVKWHKAYAAKGVVHLLSYDPDLKLLVSYHDSDTKHGHKSHLMGKMFAVSATPSADDKKLKFEMPNGWARHVSALYIIGNSLFIGTAHGGVARYPLPSDLKGVSNNQVIMPSILRTETKSAARVNVMYLNSNKQLYVGASSGAVYTLQLDKNFIAMQAPKVIISDKNAHYFPVQSIYPMSKDIVGITYGKKHKRFSEGNPWPGVDWYSVTAMGGFKIYKEAMDQVEDVRANNAFCSCIDDDANEAACNRDKTIKYCREILKKQH